MLENFCIAVQMLLIFILLQLISVLGCHQTERDALVKFKLSFSDPANRLSSWTGEDCCQWKGVTCNNYTGFVISIDLQASPVWDFDDPLSLNVPPYQLQARMLDRSLVELKHLNYLDLSGNDFQGSQIPEFIGSFQYLRYINFSMASFKGTLPSQLGNLTRLEVLYLDSSNLYGSRPHTDLRWVSRLENLRALDLSGVSLTPIDEAMLRLRRLPSLVKLRLQDCELGNIHLSHAFLNSTLISRIQALDLSMNLLGSSLPPFLENMSSLRSLDLSFNLFNGSIPLWLKNLKGLEYLSLRGNSFSHVEGNRIMGIVGNPCEIKEFDMSWNYVLEAEMESPPENFSECTAYKSEVLDLSNNKITGTMPNWLGDLKKLRRLNIGGNILTGMIPSSVGSLPNLEELSLLKNGFNGTMPSSLQELSSLRILDLSHNSLNDTIPTFLGKLSSLTHLELSNNHLRGTIPEGLGQLKTLTRIGLSTNFLKGVVSNSHLDNLSSLKSLDLRSNSLTLNLTSDWQPSFQLTELQLSFCRIKSQFPQWIQTQKQLILMDLSNTEISGKLPKWFWNMNFIGLNLSHNQITGPIIKLSRQLEYADLSYNLFSGSLPQGESLKGGRIRTSLCQLRGLHLLDLQKNRLSGTIPDCWDAGGLYTINLSSNKLSGLIPKSIGRLSRLMFLNLNNNALEGIIPETFNRSRGLIILDLGDNKLSGEIPSFNAKSHPSLQILRLRGNQLFGVIPTQLCSLRWLQILDLASNNLSGIIPQCFGRMNGMDLLPTARNSSSTDITSPGPPAFPIEETTIEVLKGEELQYTTTLVYVVNLDLSCNQLVGSIPEELTSLSGLIGLNLSENHLTGNIPKKIGEMTLLESLDLSNNALSGTIPSSISALTFLSHLNLSYNNLHGEIPSGNQLQTLSDPSKIYAGNPGLCGDQLAHKCKSNHGVLQSGAEEDEEEDPLDKVFCAVVMLGFATGFWGVIGILVLVKKWRESFFLFVDKILSYNYRSLLKWVV